MAQVRRKDHYREMGSAYANVKMNEWTYFKVRIQNEDVKVQTIYRSRRHKRQDEKKIF